MNDPWYDEETQQHYKLAPYENGIGLFSCNADGSSGYLYRPIPLTYDDSGHKTGCLDDRWSTEQILARRCQYLQGIIEHEDSPPIMHVNGEVECEPEKHPEIIDLMAALKASLNWKPEGNIG